MPRNIRITHRASGTVIAEGPIGWGITPFEGNYYISHRYLKATFKPNWIPGLCIYKFLYVWMDLVLANGDREESLSWLYWLPNPLFPFIWYRVAVSGLDDRLEYLSSGKAIDKTTVTSAPDAQAPREAHLTDAFPPRVALLT